MRDDRTLSTPESPESARAKIAAYLEQAGYKLQSAGPLLVYQRGSFLGTLWGLSAKAFATTVRVDIRSDADGRTWVYALIDANTGSTPLFRKYRLFWQGELDGLVAAVGGTSADPAQMPASPQGAAGESLQQAAQVEARLRLQNQVRSAANWFYFIAGFSVVNTIALRGGWNVTFLVGLAMTAFVDGFAVAAAKAGTAMGTVLTFIAVGVEILIAGLFVLFGLAGRKGQKWAFIAGMIVYALDAAIWLAFQGYLPFAFHLLGLIVFYTGLRALGQAGKAETARPAAAEGERWGYPK